MNNYFFQMQLFPLLAKLTIWCGKLNRYASRDSFSSISKEYAWIYVLAQRLQNFKNHEGVWFEPDYSTFEKICSVADEFLKEIKTIERDPAHILNFTQNDIDDYEAIIAKLKSTVKKVTPVFISVLRCERYYMESPPQGVHLEDEWELTILRDKALDDGAYIHEIAALYRNDWGEIKERLEPQYFEAFMEEFSTIETYLVLNPVEAKGV